MISENIAMQLASIKWLVEVGLVDDPRVINSIKVNILGTYPEVNDVELLILNHPPRKQILIYLDLKPMGFLTKNFTYLKHKEEQFRNDLIVDVEDVVSQMIPGFEVKATTDLDFFTERLEAVQVALGVNG